jgi:hypothetical protein
MLGTQAQIIEVSGDLLLHIVKGLKERRRARSSRSRSRSGFDGVLGDGKTTVESQVLVESIS